ncbi:MAG TPA: thermonuclease family protein [Verrucomicrobiae bacterium]|jgi:micrococcal nuclease|nr:thermonuclease family protein [Verrucomicrobiae bacterium]
MLRIHYCRLVRGRLVIALILVVCLAVYAQRQGWLGNAAKTAESNQPGLYSVNRFIDGDTIAVNMNGQVEKVRFIGVDTPETHKPNTPVQCYGPVAAAFTKSTIGQSRVRLVSDSLSTNRDRYNRLLRYVYLPDGTNLDELLIRTGHGFYYPYFPFSKSHQFAADEQTAIASHLGLWSACHPTPTDSGGYISNTQ